MWLLVHIMIHLVLDNQIEGSFLGKTTSLRPLAVCSSFARRGACEIFAFPISMSTGVVHVKVFLGQPYYWSIILLADTSSNTFVAPLTLPIFLPPLLRCFLSLRCRSHITDIYSFGLETQWAFESCMFTHCDCSTIVLVVKKTVFGASWHIHLSMDINISI